MKYSIREIVNMIDFLSARFGINENTYFEERDDIIIDSINFLREKENAGNLSKQMNNLREDIQKLHLEGSFNDKDFEKINKCIDFYTRK